MLPSLGHHVWGRVLAVGSLTFNITTLLMSEPLTNQRRLIIGQYTLSPLRVEGRGHSWIGEWSDSTFLVLSRVINHIKTRYIPSNGILLILYLLFYLYFKEEKNINIWLLTQIFFKIYR